jgi:hypothetical protein
LLSAAGRHLTSFFCCRPCCHPWLPLSRARRGERGARPCPAKAQPSRGSPGRADTCEPCPAAPRQVTPLLDRVKGVDAAKKELAEMLMKAAEEAKKEGEQDGWREL